MKLKVFSREPTAYPLIFIYLQVIPDPLPIMIWAFCKHTHKVVKVKIFKRSETTEAVGRKNIHSTSASHWGFSVIIL